MTGPVYAARRLLLAVPLLLGMSLLVFGLMRVIPGDPAVAVLGYKATPESIRAMRESFHLDEPLLTQYARWCGGVLRGDFGIDFRQNEPIGRMIVERLPVTVELTALASLAAALIGVPLGLLAGARRGGVADRASLALGLLGISLPDFWLGIMLILVLSLAAGIMPSSGFVPFAEAPLENLWYLALPNAAIPIVTVIGLQVGYMLGGAIVVETIFTLPGLGRMTLDAVLERNYPVVQSGLLVVGAMFMVVNLVTDVLYGLLDPRLRRR